MASVVVLDLIHFTQPMAECRNEIRMDPAMRLEEPDRRLLRVLGERPRRPPRRDMNSRRFIMRNSTRLIAVYPAGRDQKLAYSPGACSRNHVVRPRTRRLRLALLRLEVMACGGPLAAVCGH